MPPIPYRYYHCDDLPELEIEEEVASQAQLSMPWGDATAHSKLRYLGHAEDPQFERYHVEHQMEEDVDAFYNQTHIRRLIRVLNFPAYYHRETGYFLVATGKSPARVLFNRLKHREPPINAEKGQLNLEVVQRMGMTTGGWFGDLLVADLKTVGLFGSDSISQSEEWEHYTDVGSISALQMKLDGEDGVRVPVMVTADRLILMMRNLGEGENLRFVRYLNERFDELGQA